MNRPEAASGTDLGRTVNLATIRFVLMHRMSTKRAVAPILVLLAVLAWSAALGATGEAPEPVDVLGLSPEIESYLDSRMRTSLPRSARVQRLLDILFGRDGLDIVYGNSETKTATQTFEARSGNCLSFTLLFVAMARHVGLEAHFQEVGEILSWDRRGDVAVSNRHMFAEVETGEGTLQVDFLPGAEKRYRLVQRVGEDRVLAHFYSNLGAEALTADDTDRATMLLSRALEADDTLASAWVNMGVANRRAGRLAEAERCYLRALELDRNEISAASNLAGLYKSSGRDRLAAPYLKKIRKHRQKNPFYHFRRGLDLAAEGDLKAAGRRLRRAVQLLPDDAMFRIELGRVQARAGRLRRAERSFRKALELSDGEAQRDRVRALLDRVRADRA